jgi:hypothetical protein
MAKDLMFTDLMFTDSGEERDLSGTQGFDID